MKILIVTNQKNLSEYVRNILEYKIKDTDLRVVNDFEYAAQVIYNSSIKVNDKKKLSNDTTRKCVLDIVFLDESIGGKAVLIFLSKVRNFYDSKNLPIIVFTAGKNVNEVKRYINAGANHLILLPIDSKILNKKVAEIMEERIDHKTAKTVSIFKKSNIKPKKRVNILSMLSSPSRSNKTTGLIGAFHEPTKKNNSNGQKIEDSKPLDLGGKKVNGHYHKKVDVIGGAINCFWAKEDQKGEQISLEYITQKGLASGIHVQYVKKSDFVLEYLLCTPDVCQILKRLAK